MSKFFNQLVSENLIANWAEVLDWIFDDLKFSKERNWNGGYTSLFAKKIKQIPGIKNQKFLYEKINPSDFPNQIKGSRRKRSALIMMVKGESVAKDLIRHIRNGIAHGQTKMYKVGSELYIEILDFMGETKSLNKQTAFICIPIDYIIAFYKVYSEINLSIMNTKTKDRKLRDKQKRSNN